MAGQLNLHFLHAEAREFLAAIPDRLRFGRVFVLFPDPWPKRRHRKNRLVNASALERITAVTREGAELYFRSDAFDYGAEVGVLLGRHGSWVVLHDAHLPIDTATVFQKKARSYGTVAARRV